LAQKKNTVQGRVLRKKGGGQQERGLGSEGSKKGGAEHPTRN